MGGAEEGGQAEGLLWFKHPPAVKRSWLLLLVSLFLSQIVW